MTDRPPAVQDVPASPSGTGAAPNTGELLDAIRTLAAADFREIQRLGWHFQRKTWASPLNDVEFLDANRDLWAGKSNRESWAGVDPACIDWRPVHQLAVAREVGAFVHELAGVPHESSQAGSFQWNNPMWANADALVQYGLYRSRKPKRVVEIGCGWSSLLAALALRRNQAEGGHQTRVVQVEPLPRRDLMASLPSHWEMHATILQRAPLSIFDQLEEGDVLFYDGSHCAKVASDVNWFFFHVLPRLRPGVLIHIHDISLPQDYHEDWIFNRGQTWNEQYVLQAFMMHNRAYQIEIANAYIFFKHEAELRAIYGNIQPVYGSSFWMRKLDESLAPAGRTATPPTLGHHGTGHPDAHRRM